MNRKNERNGRRGRWSWLAGAMLLVAGTAPHALAQSPYSPIWTKPAPTASNSGLPATVLTFAQEKQKEGQKETPPVTMEPGPVSVAAGCVGCGPNGCMSCVPGRLHDCGHCNRDTLCGRIFCGFYEELCCPDPCYEGKWIPAANAAFFVEGTRPVSTTRFRWDYGRNYNFPDRAEFFWARSGGGGKGPAAIERSLNYNEISMYTEIAAKGASAFVNIPYRSINAEVNPHSAGFSDMSVGAKTLLFDRDLFQLGFMFTTYLPVGRAGGGLGTGHVSLEPSLLGTLKLGPDTYMQGQLSEWIPIAGDPEYAGSILHYHGSLNHVLFRPVSDVELIGTLEFNGYSFQDGAFSDPFLGQFQKASADSYFSAGPGIRLVICYWLDFGVGSAFSIGDHGPDQMYRTELRIRY
ncbi:MAG: hypothetical protein L0215_07215 [Gemmataceae bacterium]|nr:hypothetical protein [Gemmataceae bacterium]